MASSPEPTPGPKQAHRPPMTLRSNRLFLALGGFFIANALLAEFIGAKIFSLEATFGFQPLAWSLFGQDDLSLNLTAGVLLWPFVFVMTDIINEYFGRPGVKLISWLTVGLIAYAFLMVGLAIETAPAPFWITDPVSGLERNEAFAAIFGQGLWIIVGSLVAFLVGQLVDVLVFQAIKRRTGEKAIWLRATGSTLVSQALDSFVVLFIAFYWGAGWSLELVLALAVMNYTYKVSAAILLTPLLYVAHWAIDRYLGQELAKRLRNWASNPNVGHDTIAA